MFKGSRPRRAARFLPRSARAPAVEAARWTVEKLVGQFASKEMLLPEMQRGYVWTPEKARALIDSLYKDYPSGSMLLWEARPWTRGPDGRGDGGAYLLLDGQQRLTSLYAIITGAPVRTRRGGAVQESRIEVFFNMDHPDFPIDPDTEEADDRSGHSLFRLKSPAVAGSPRWIDVTRLFREGESAVLAEKAEPGDPNRQKYLERLSALRNRLTTYFYPVQILDRDMPYAQVADVFVRVNSHGSGTRKSDLALAQVTSRWRGSMGLFARLSEECSEKGYDLDEGFVLKCLMSVAAGKSGLGGVGSTPINQIRESWEKTRASLLFAIGFLKNAGVETAEILPAKLPIIPMVCMAAKHDCRFPSSMERPITRWFYAAVMRGRYSGGSAALDEDLGLIKKLRAARGTDGGKHPPSVRQARDRGRGSRRKRRKEPVPLHDVRARAQRRREGLEFWTAHRRGRRTAVRPGVRSRRAQSLAGGKARRRKGTLALVGRRQHGVRRRARRPRTPQARRTPQGRRADRGRRRARRAVCAHGSGAVAARKVRVFSAAQKAGDRLVHQRSDGVAGGAVAPGFAGGPRARGFGPTLATMKYRNPSLPQRWPRR